MTQFSKHTTLFIGLDAQVTEALEMFFYACL